MRALDGEDITQADLEDLGFGGEGEVQTALNDAYVQLLEFVHARDARRTDPAADRAMRQSLQPYLDNIVAACDREARARSS
ncbi:MAG: hypothetical protein GEU95_26320 [Rhizobiales bacterium]|nr:hypothetical protein [Hyphomicrobiales bacterium]